MYLHLLKNNGRLELNDFPFTAITKAYLLSNKQAVKPELNNGHIIIRDLPPVTDSHPDVVVVLEGR